MKLYSVVSSVVILAYVTFEIDPATIETGTCGVSVLRDVNSLKRIVNGNVSQPGQWPWMVLIEENGGHICGGTLIDSQWIVTAAHCITNDVSKHSPVILGAHRIDGKDETAQEHYISSKWCHRGYVENTFENDICLLKLYTPVNYNDYIQPACLPVKGRSIVYGDICTVTGWGSTEGTGSEVLLREANIEVLNTSVCRSWYKEAHVKIPTNHFCAGYEEGGIDSCQGDSGGPLVCRGTSSSGSRGFILKGITSFGLDCALPRRPGVYVNVEKYLGWITDTMQANNGTDPLPVCSHLNPTSCGGNITEESFIRNPIERSTLKYPAGSNCLWNVTAPVGFGIKFTFMCYFVLDENCADSLIIITDSGLSRRFCGKALPDSFRVSDRSSTVSFYSDHQDQGSGFVLKIAFHKLPTTPATTTTVPAPTTSAANHCVIPLKLADILILGNILYLVHWGMSNYYILIDLSSLLF